MTLAQPRVSVLCLTYNQEAFIGEALAGVLAQEYDDLELVVCDDGSTDRTLDVVAEFAERHPRLRVVVAGGPHVGITANCNRGLARCSGEFIALTAGDDVCLPGKISAQVAWFDEDERRAVCGHDVEAFDSATGARLYLWSEYHGLAAGAGATAAVASIPYCGTAVMLRRSAIPAWGFDSRLAIVSDWKLVIDALRPDRVFGFVPGVLARYRRHPGNVTNVREWGHATRMLAESLTLFALVEAEYPELVAACRHARAPMLLFHGKRLWDRGERGAARAYFAEALRCSPVQIAAWLARRAVRGPLGTPP